jgi:hypothetical protein
MVRWTQSAGIHFTIGSSKFLADAYRSLSEAYGLVGGWCATLSDV